MLEVASAEDKGNSGHRAPGSGAMRTTLFRLLALGFPFALLLLVEGTFRVVGIGAPEGAVADPWANPLVAFEEGTSFFPEWDQNIAMPKPDGVKRVFVVGGSSAAGFGVDVPFSKTLESELRTKLGTDKIEVINGGVGAAGSHRVYEVIRRAGAFDPDLFVVYFGHNEFLEDVFFDPNGLVARAEQTGRLARRFYVVNALRTLFDKPADVKLTGEKTILKSRFLGTMNFPLIKDDEQVRQKMLFLESNMQRMIDFAKAHDARIVFVPAEPSVLTGPSWVEHGPGFDKDPDGFNAAYGEAKTAMREKRYADALAAITKAKAIDDAFAMVPYVEGLALLGLGRHDEGVTALRRAVLLDKNGDRSNAIIEKTIVDTATREGVPHFSIAKAFDAEMPADFARLVEAGGLEDFLAARKPGHTLFLDHCHPSARGHVLIAETLARALVDSGTL
jgi:lysophospholipase L1-like esterase